MYKTGFKPTNINQEIQALDRKKLNKSEFNSFFNGSTLNISGTTESTSSTTGALVVSGGVGISKNTNIGGNAIIRGNVNFGDIFIQSISSSESFSGSALDAFDSNPTTKWVSRKKYSIHYNYQATGTGEYTSFASNFYINGEWIQVIYTRPLLLTEFFLLGETQSKLPKDLYLIGSNDGANWNIIMSSLNNTYNSTVINSITMYQKLFTVSINTEYSHYRLIVSSITATDDETAVINQLKLNFSASDMAIYHNINSVLKVVDTTQSSSTTTGALVVSGGVGVSGSMHLGGRLGVVDTVLTAPITNVLQVGNGERLRVANYNPAVLESDYSLIGTSESGPNDNTRIVISAKYRTGLEGRIEYITTGAGPHIWSTGGSIEKMRLTSTGRLGIGTSNPTHQLNVSTDSAAKPFSSAWTISSDERVKENIVDADLNLCYEDIKALKLRRFKYKDEFLINHEQEDKNVLGFIAQEVKQIYPKSVEIKLNEQYNIGDFHTLNIDQLIKSLFGCVQLIIKKLEILENKISQLNL